MNLDLPKSKVKKELNSPEKLFIYSKPKTGKTEALSLLDNCLILDLEKGSKYIDAMKIEIDSLEHLKAVLQKIIDEGRPYKYIAVDTITKLEDYALHLALDLYKATPMGANFKGLNVLHLPQGAGYQYLRDAMKLITDKIEQCADRIIYLGHLKTKSIENGGKEVTYQDIDLTGKVRSSMSASVDAVGYLYRSGNQNILTFKTKEEVICGCRSEHLSNQDVVLSEKIDGKLVAHWDRIFID